MKEEGFPPPKTVKWEIKLPCELRKSRVMLGQGKTGKSLIVPQPWVTSPFSPGEMQGEGRKWAGSFGTGSVWHQPSGPDSCVLGGSRQEPCPKGAVGRTGELVGGEKLQRGSRKEASPSKALFSVCTGRQDLFRDNIFPHCDSSGRRCKCGWSQSSAQGLTS